jgi:hypothetical protein
MATESLTGMIADKACHLLLDHVGPPIASTCPLVDGFDEIRRIMKLGVRGMCI